MLKMLKMLPVVVVIMFIFNGCAEKANSRTGFFSNGIHKDTQTKYNKEGYSKFGRDKNGFNKMGYDYWGHDKNGYDKNGYERKKGSRSKDLNYKYGFDISGYDRKGYNKYGFDKNGYDKNGYDNYGCGQDGFDKNGYDKNGFDTNGYDKGGLDESRYDRDGYEYHLYDKNGYDRDGYNKEGYDKKKLNKHGFDEEGYDNEGYNKDGYSRAGYNRKGYNSHGESSKSKIKKLMHSQSTIKKVVDSILKQSKKGKYESSSEYLERIEKNKSKKYAIIRASTTYSFIPNYNADKKEYHLRFQLSEKVYDKDTSYIGTNAFGIKRRLYKNTTKIYRVSPTNFERMYLKSRKFFKNNYFEITLPVTKKMAIKYDKEKFLLKANIILNTTSKVKNRHTNDKETMIQPHGYYREYFDVEGYVKELVVYNKKTKEIIFQYLD